MKSVSLTDSEIRAFGWDALVERLGASGAARFAMQTEPGHGDYSDARHADLGSLTVDDLVARTRATRPKTPRRRR